MALIPYATYQQMLGRDPVAAVEAMRAGNVDLPADMRHVYASSFDRSTGLDRLAQADQSRPAPTAESAIETARQQNADHAATVRAIEASTSSRPWDEGGEVEVPALPEDAEPISFQRWSQMTKDNPTRARAFHAAGLVEMSDELHNALRGGV